MAERKQSEGRADGKKAGPVAKSSGLIRVLLADDHAGIRQTLRYIFEQQPDMTVVGEAADGQSAVMMACELEPDVMLLDINMPIMTGIEAVKRIHKAVPSVRVIGLSVHHDAAVARRMKAAGAAAYMVKGGQVQDLCDAVRQVYRKQADAPAAAGPDA